MSAGLNSESIAKKQTNIKYAQNTKKMTAVSKFRKWSDLMTLRLSFLSLIVEFVVIDM